MAEGKHRSLKNLFPKNCDESDIYEVYLQNCSDIKVGVRNADNDEQSGLAHALVPNETVEITQYFVPLDFTEAVPNGQHLIPHKLPSHVSNFNGVQHDRSVSRTDEFTVPIQ